MSFFKWDESQLGLNIESIDREHETLIELMNKLHGLKLADAAKVEIWIALAKLSRYMTWHFRNEERYMESISFPDVENHRMLHKQLGARMEKHLVDFQQNGGELTQEFFDFLKIWLTAHIMGIDKEYAKYAQRSSS